MIDEMICELDSPGSMSTALMMSLLFRDPIDVARGRHPVGNNGNVPRVSFTLSGAPNWLAAESVLATECLPLRTASRVHVQCQCAIANNSR